MPLRDISDQKRGAEHQAERSSMHRTAFFQNIVNSLVGTRFAVHDHTEWSLS